MLAKPPVKQSSGPSFHASSGFDWYSNSVSCFAGPRDCGGSFKSPPLSSVSLESSGRLPTSTSGERVLEDAGCEDAASRGRRLLSGFLAGGGSDSAARSFPGRRLLSGFFGGGGGGGGGNGMEEGGGGASSCVDASATAEALLPPLRRSLRPRFSPLRLRVLVLDLDRLTFGGDTDHA